MKKNLLYKYLGTNGVITSPIYLENIYSVKQYQLIAGKNKKITKNNIDFFNIVTIPEQEIEEWYEVDDPLIGQE